MSIMPSETNRDDQAAAQMLASRTADLLAAGKLIKRLEDENARLRTALEIAAPYISKRSDRGRAADVVVFSALGAETYRRLGLRGYEVAIPDGMPEDDGGVGYGTY